MASRPKKALTALAALFAFSFSQVYVQAVLTTPPTGGSTPQRLIAARLSTTANRPILVNGNSVATGASILTGVTIETPDQVSAKIDLGEAGVVELQPTSKIQLDFDADGNVRVKVIRGCAVTRKKVNGIGEAEIYTDQASEKTDRKRRHMGFCALPNGQLSPLNAGLSPTTELEIAGGAGAGIATAIWLATRGGNPSPVR
ncbi:MAG: hypothetical protein ABJC05_09730 [Pyrinomonadaceae bacterium]